MPDLLAALIAFIAEHQRCGDLDSGLEAGVVWLSLLVLGPTRPAG